MNRVPPPAVAPRRWTSENMEEEKRWEDIYERLGTTASKFQATLDAEIQKTTAQLTDLETKVQGLGTGLGALSGEVGSLTDRVKAVEELQKTFADEQAAIGTRVTQLEITLTGIQMRLSALEAK